MKGEAHRLGEAEHLVGHADLAVVNHPARWLAAVLAMSRLIRTRRSAVLTSAPRACKRVAGAGATCDIITV